MAGHSPGGVPLGEEGLLHLKWEERRGRLENSLLRKRGRTLNSEDAEPGDTENTQMRVKDIYDATCPQPSEWG